MKFTQKLQINTAVEQVDHIASLVEEIRHMWLETQRLILREFIREDVPQLAPILANSEVMKFSAMGVLSLSQTHEKIESFMASYKEFGFGKWAVIFKETNKIIGYCRIAVEQIDDRQEREIGYRLNPHYWGRGLATEAASATLRYGVEQLKLPYILGVVERANTASVRVLKKLGMRYERETIFCGLAMDIYVYRVVRAASTIPGSGGKRVVTTQ